MSEPKEHQQVWNQVFHRLLDRFTLERTDRNGYWDTFERELAQHYPPELMFMRNGLLSPAERELQKTLQTSFQSNAIKDFVIVREGQNIVAMFNGYQKEVDVYYMQHSIVHPNYRRMGVYSIFTQKVLDYTNRLGFLQVVSCHSPVNNSVLIAKMRMGFHVTSMELHAEYGPNLWLTYFHSQELKKAFEFRCGMVDFTKSMFENSEGSSQKLLTKLSEFS